MCEYDGAGSYKKLFIYGNYIDEVLLMKAGENDYYYAHDHLYSPAALIDSSGTVLERCEYDAYGNCSILEPNFAPDPDGRSDYGNNYLFTGRRLDILNSSSLKIQYNRNRYYDYYTGRWLTHDPLGIVPNSLALNFFMPPQQYSPGMSLYEYVSSNPEMGIDPWGLDRRDERRRRGDPGQDSPCEWDESDEYKIGTKGPALMPWEHGRWNRASVPWYHRLKVLDIQGRAGAMIGYGSFLDVLPDAQLHFRRYISNTGLQIDTSLTRMIRDSDEVKGHFIRDVDNAMAEAEKILAKLSGPEREGGVDIVQKGYSHRYVYDDKNWQYAIQTYHTWGKGSNVRKGKGRKNCCYYMYWTYNLRDNYEFENRHIKGRYSLVWDDEMWLLNKYGIARHFRIRAVKSLDLTWIKGYSFKDRYGVLAGARLLNRGRQLIFPQCE